MGIEGAPVLEQLGRDLPLVDPAVLDGAASLRLAARAASVRSARDFTRDILATWRLSHHFDAAALVVSELVTNALRHGVEVSARQAGDPTAPVELELLRGARRLVCAVHDPCGTEPRVNDPGVASESGRGLRLVESFSDSWGWRPHHGSRTGKVVWASFRLT